MNRSARPLFYLSLLGISALAACAAPAAHTGLTPAQIAVLQQAGFSPAADNSWQLGLSDKVLFASNSDKLNPVTGTQLEGLGKNLASVQIIRLRVEGYTDGFGTDAYNDQLSLRRAQAVADKFENAGFLQTNVTALGLGKRDPVASNATPAGQAQNRRVAIIVPPDQ